MPESTHSFSDLPALFDDIEAEIRALLRDRAELRNSLRDAHHEFAEVDNKWVLRVISIADAFDRVLKGCDVQSAGASEQMRTFVSGFRAVRRLVERHLADARVVVMPHEEMYDKHRHTIAETVEDDAKANGQIIETLQPAYARGDDIVRKASVRVVRHSR